MVIGKIKWRVRGVLEQMKFCAAVKRSVLKKDRCGAVPVGGNHRFQTAFLSGCGRSGTTLLGKMIELHTHTHFFNEAKYREVGRGFNRDNIATFGYGSQRQ